MPTPRPVAWDSRPPSARDGWRCARFERGPGVAPNAPQLSGRLRRLTGSGNVGRHSAGVIPSDEVSRAESRPTLPSRAACARRRPKLGGIRCGPNAPPTAREANAVPEPAEWSAAPEALEPAVSAVVPGCRRGPICVYAQAGAGLQAAGAVHPLEPAVSAVVPGYRRGPVCVYAQAGGGLQAAGAVHPLEPAVSAVVPGYRRGRRAPGGSSCL
jgi:hypothetical protein